MVARTVKSCNIRVKGYESPRTAKDAVGPVGQSGFCLAEEEVVVGLETRFVYLARVARKFRSCPMASTSPEMSSACRRARWRRPAPPTGLRVGFGFARPVLEGTRVRLAVRLRARTFTIGTQDVPRGPTPCLPSQSFAARESSGVESRQLASEEGVLGSIRYTSGPLRARLWRLSSGFATARRSALTINSAQ